jgi:hypothetical protein
VLSRGIEGASEQDEGRGTAEGVLFAGQRLSKAITGAKQSRSGDALGQQRTSLQRQPIAAEPTKFRGLAETVELP